MILKKTEYHDKVFTKQELAKKIFEGKRFENCKFEHCQFDDVTFLSCKFVDCEFIDCSLNNIKITNTAWNNVVFERCKMLGINWTEARWPQIKLTCPNPTQNNIKKCTFSEPEVINLLHAFDITIK